MEPCLSSDEQVIRRYRMSEPTSADLIAPGQFLPGHLFLILLPLLMAGWHGMTGLYTFY